MVGVFIVFNSMALRDFAKRLIVTQSYYQFGIKVEVKDVRISYFRPAVRIQGIKLIKEDPKYKVNLSAEEASVYFNIIKLIRGKVGISGIKLEKPDLSIFMDLNYDDKKLDINIASILKDLEKGDLKRVIIEDGNIDLSLATADKTEIFDLNGFNVNIRKGIISNFVLEMSADSVKLPIEQIKSFELRADIKDKQLKINKADITVDGGKIYAGGTLSDVTDYKRSLVNMSWKTEFDLSYLKEYQEYLKDDFSKDIKSGSLLAGGKTYGEISGGLKKMSLDVSADIKDLLWDDMLIPKLALRSSFKDENIFISHLDISDGEKSISINDTKLMLSAPYSVSGKGSVNHIDLSRYLELFDIKRCLSKFNINGPFSFSGVLRPEFKITGDFDLYVKDFWVLKKKGAPVNRENSILDFKDGHVFGKVHFSAKGAYFDNFKAKSQNNMMTVSGWIKNDSTVDLDVKASDFSMNTYGRIEDLPVLGKGDFQTKLIVDENGDFKTFGNIDFADVKLLDGYHLGSISSKITYLNEVLSFSDLKGKIGNSKYSGNINLIFGKDNEVDLRGNGIVKDAYTGDIYKLFGSKEKLFGSPSAIVNGVVKLSGRPSWEGIKLDCNLDISDIEFFAERFDKANFDFTWDKGELKIDDAYITRGSGRFDIDGTRKNGVLSLSLRSNKIDVSDIMALSSRAEIDGDLTVKGDVKHFNKKLSGSLKFNFSDLSMDRNKLKPVNAELVFGDTIDLKFNVFDGAATGDLVEQVDGTYKLRSNLRALDVYPLTGIFMSSEAEPFKTGINGHIDLLIDKNGSIKWGTLDIEELKLYSGFMNLSNKGKISAQYKNSVYYIKDTELLMDYDGGVCKLGFNNNGNNVLIKGCVPVSLLRVFKEQITGARGKIDIDLSYGNKLNGTSNFRDVSITTYGHKLGTINAVGKMLIDNNVLKFGSFSLNAGGASASFNGTINMDKIFSLSGLYPAFNVGVKIDKLFLDYPDGFRGRWEGNIDVRGERPPYSITGVMNVYDGTYRKDIEVARLALSKGKKIDDTVLFKRSKPNLQFDIKLKTANDIYVKNTTMTGEVAFDLGLKGTDVDPKLVGSVDLLNGNFIYFDNTFELLSGRVKFRDDDVEPIVYQLDSEAKINNYQVFLKMVSEKGEPKFSVSSTPPLTEEKILTLLATGDVQSDFMDQGGFTAGTGGNIVSEGLGVTGSIKKNTGVGMKLKAPKDKDSTIPDIEFQKDLTNDLKVIYGKSLDENTNKQEVNVQYDVNRNVQLKLLFEEENKENASQNKPSNAGVDIKFKFEF